MKRENSQKRADGGGSGIRDRFALAARKTSEAVGSAWAFILAVMTVLIWGITGPLFGYSDTWQLVINTSTTIVTFLMVFLIQSTQNRDSKAMHLKIDGLIHAMHEADDDLLNLENISEDELEALTEHFARLHERALKAGDAHSKGPTPKRARNGGGKSAPGARKVTHAKTRAGARSGG
jgi:low affinity Fe/Cu permease